MAIEEDYGEASNPLIRQRILDALRLRCRHEGIKSVGMRDLAQAVGISTKTLYREFDGKAALVRALLEDIAAKFESVIAAANLRTVDEASEELAEMVIVWFDLWSAFSEKFWLELREDYPEAYAIFQQRLDMDIDASRQRLAPFVKAGVSYPIAELIVSAAAQAARDPVWLRKLNLTQADAIRQIVSIWSKGALG